MSIHVTDFKWEKGINDARYIELLEKTLKNEQRVTALAMAKVRKLAKENKELSNVIDEYLQYVKLGTVEEFKDLKVENEELHCEIQAINATMDLLENEIRAKAIDEFTAKLTVRTHEIIDLTATTEGLHKHNSLFSCRV